MPSRLYFVETKPSNVNDKYVGSSETAIKNLFKYAIEIATREYKAVIIFF